MCLHGFSDSVHTFCSFVLLFSFFNFPYWTRPVLTACLLTKLLRQQRMCTRNLAHSTKPPAPPPTPNPSPNPNFNHIWMIYFALMAFQTCVGMTLKWKIRLKSVFRKKKKKKKTDRGKFYKHNFTHTGPAMSKKRWQLRVLPPADNLSGVARSQCWKPPEAIP